MQEGKIPYASIGLTDKRPVKVYDAEQKQLIHQFESIKAAAIFLQVSESTITSCLRTKNRMRAETNKLKIQLAIR